MTAFGQPTEPKKAPFVWKFCELTKGEEVISICSATGGVFVATNRRVFRLMNDNKLVELEFGEMVPNVE